MKGHACLHSRDYAGAINTFKNLENSVLTRNVDILATLGETYYLAGDSKNALCMLQRVRYFVLLYWIRIIDKFGKVISQNNRYKILLLFDAAILVMSQASPFRLFPHCFGNYKSFVGNY